MSGEHPQPAARLLPEAPLPPYTYVAGRFPHPTRDPAGHSYGHTPDEPPPLDPQCWPEARSYLLGFDLFNFGYYWESHETWEGLWKACGRHGTTADFLKGLIKLAAAGVKVREGRLAGVRRHGARAAQLFRQVHVALSAGEAAAKFCGFDLLTLVAIADDVARHGDLPAPTADAVQVVFDFQLRPRA